MDSLIDASVWIDFIRARSPQSLKRFIAPYLGDPNAHLAEPVVFELLRHATVAEVKLLTQQFQTLPTLSTPQDLWSQATHLGQVCRRKGITPLALDLLIATIAIHHSAEVVTFDDDYAKIATVSSLQVKLLKRPTP